MSQITSHILDTTTGKPAAGVDVILCVHREDGWTVMARSVTDNDGRVKDLLPKEVSLVPGTYKIKFQTREYFDARARPSFYPYVEIAFEVAGSEHYHIPLLLSPFGYTTYRGS